MGPDLTYPDFTSQRTPARHPPDTRQTPSRQFPYTLQTPTRQSPKIRHVWSFLLLKARWGLLLPSSFFFLLPWENKVNSFSNQLKLSWVCKLEWSLTIKLLKSSL